MSKPKRRTMRRLKRVLGVTAIILALLIAMIPNVGEAESKNGGAIVFNIAEQSAATLLTNDGLVITWTDLSSPSDNSGTLPDGEYRLQVIQQPGTVPSDMQWFANMYRRYTFNLQRFNGPKYKDDYLDQGGDADEDVVKNAEKQKDMYWDAPVTGKHDYTLTFTYGSETNQKVTPNTNFYPSVYYSRDGATWDYGGGLATSAAEGIRSSKGEISITSCVLKNIDEYAYVDVYVNTNPQKDFWICDPDDGNASRDYHYNNSAQKYFGDFNNSTSLTSPASILSPTENIEISASDGLKKMYLPAKKLFVDTGTAMNYSAFSNLNLGGDGAPFVLGNRAMQYSPLKMELIDAFSVKITDKDGNEMDLATRAHLKKHQMYIIFPKDGSGQTPSYEDYVFGTDVVRILYKDDSTRDAGGGSDNYWKDTGPVNHYMNNGHTEIVVPFEYEPTMTQIAVIVEHPGEAVHVFDNRSDAAYPSIVEAHPATYTEALTDSLYVNISDFEEGTVYNSMIAATAENNNDDWDDTVNYVHKTEILKVITSTNSAATASDADFIDLEISAGLNSDWNTAVASAKVYLFYHDGTQWVKNRMNVTTDSGTGRNYITFPVKDTYGENYVLYYQAYANDLSNGHIVGTVDNRKIDGSTGYAGGGANGLKASLSGKMTAGDYYLVVEDKTNQLWISDSKDLVGNYDECYHYNIYIGKRSDVDNSQYEDYSKNITFDAEGVTVTLPLPKSWKVSPQTVRLVRAHKATDSSEPEINYNYSFKAYENQIEFTSNAFSEYAAYYKEPSDEPTPDEYDFDVDDNYAPFGSLFTLQIGDVLGKTSKAQDSNLWKLALRDPDTGDINVTNMEAAILSSTQIKTNSKTRFYPFYGRLFYSTNGGTSYNEVTNQDYGSETMTVYLPVPSDLNYTNGASLAVVGFDPSATQVNTRIRKLESSVPFVYNNGSYITFTLDGSKKDLSSYNPFTIVYTPASSGDDDNPDAGSSASTANTAGTGASGKGAANAMEIDTYDTELYPEENDVLPPGTTKAIDLKEYGKMNATTTMTMEDGEKLRIIVSQYTDPNNTAIGKAIQNSSMSNWNKKKSTIKAYDIKLKKTDKNGNVTWPSTPVDMDGQTVTITLPYNSKYSDPNGTISVWTLDSSGSLENLVAETAASSGGNATFTTTHFSQYAILYNKGTASKSDTGSSKSSSSDDSSSKSNNGNSSSSSSSSTASSSSSNASTASSGSSSTGGGGGNRASGDQSYNGTGKANTADATTYKAIFILILLAFGAFELVSSMPAKRKARTNQGRSSGNQ